MNDNQDTDLQRLINCLKGDAPARERVVRELLHVFAYERLRRLAARILNEQWPRVRQLPDVRTTNIVNALLERLEKALQTVGLHDPKHLFRLAAEHIRYILLDRARHLDELVRGGKLNLSGMWADEPRTPPALWLRLDEEIDKLPGEQKEVVLLIFWLGMNKPQVAEYLGCHVNSVYHRWVQARLALKEVLGGDLPPPERD